MAGNLDKENGGVPTPPVAPRDLDLETVGVQPNPISLSVLPQPEQIESSDSKTRNLVAFALLTLLAAIVVAAFVELFIINGAVVPARDVTANTVSLDSDADSARLMSLMNVVFGPVVTLFSSVVGFYFGARTAKEGAASPVPTPTPPKAK